MNNILFIIVAILISTNNYAQTLIATSKDPNATANHTQRKIIKDSNGNIFVVYTDSLNEKSVIKSVKYDVSTQQWGSPIPIAYGKNPTITISESNYITLIYESLDTLTRIRYMATHDFYNWSSMVTISDTTKKCYLPVADAKKVDDNNVFWVQEADSQNVDLIYFKVPIEMIYGGGIPSYSSILLQNKKITTKHEINDISVAKALIYDNDLYDLFLGIQYNQDSLIFLRLYDYNIIDTVYSAIGSQPNITFNARSDSYSASGVARFLFLNLNSNIIEISVDGISIICNTKDNKADYICIDDIIPPIGYSYLFMKNDSLFHAFSFGYDPYNQILLDTISTNPINPSIKYKVFDSEKIDYIWMEDNGNGYNIFYKQDDKYVWVGVEDYEKGKGFSITGFPNPFTETFTINITTENKTNIPEIKIYSSSSQLIKILKPESISGNKYVYRWNGKNIENSSVADGIYIIMAKVGNRNTARKVMFVK